LKIGCISSTALGRLRNIPAGDALDQLDPELRLGLEGDLIRHLRLAPPLPILTPILQ
jgi:hypothetical protein